MVRVVSDSFFVSSFSSSSSSSSLLSLITPLFLFASYVTRMSPATANRVVDGARSVLQDWCEDVFVYVEHPKGAEGGLSSGFGLSLVAESSTGCFLAGTGVYIDISLLFFPTSSTTAEGVGAAGQLPEDLGKRVARLLLEEIAQGGCIDTAMQSIPLILMALNTEDLCKLRVGKLSPYSYVVAAGRYLLDSDLCQHRVFEAAERLFWDHIQGRGRCRVQDSVALVSRHWYDGMVTRSS